MNTQLNKLEAKLQKLYDERSFHDSRSLFNIGVQFGSLLQQQNIQNYEYDFWKKLDEKNNKEKLVWEAVKAIDKFLLGLVQSSIRDYNGKNFGWSIAKGNWSSEYDEFDAGTRRKYCVQITRVDMTQYGGDFECTFKVVGRLAKLFQKHKVCCQFDVSVSNESGEQSTSIYRDERLSSIVHSAHCQVKNSNN